jgi:NitT/TauT family transport system substrate-binding protein
MTDTITRSEAFRRASLAALASAAGGFAFRQTAEAQGLVPITVGITASSSDAPFFIANKMGFFREAGIAVEFSSFTGAPQMIVPLGTGQLDVGSGSPSGGFYNAVMRGIDVKIVAGKASSPPGYGYNPLVVRRELVKSGKFKTPRDLKGMRVAEPAQGGTTAATLAKLLQKYGLDYKDVEHVYLSFPDQVVALANGSIDATLLNEPGATLAESKGIGVRVMSNDKWYPYQDQAEVFYGSTLLRQHRDVGVRFMTAWLKSARFYMDALVDGHLRGRTSKIVLDILTDSTPIKNRSIYSSMVSQAVDPNGNVNVTSLSEDLAFYKRTGFFKGDTKVTQAVDVDFQQEAAKRLGPYLRRNS